MDIKQNLVFYGELSTDQLAGLLRKERNFCIKCRKKVFSFNFEVSKFGLFCKGLCITCRQKLLTLFKTSASVTDEENADTGSGKIKRLSCEESETDTEKAILRRCITPNSDIFSEVELTNKHKNHIFCENTVNFSLKVSHETQTETLTVNSAAPSARLLRSLRNKPVLQSEETSSDEAVVARAKPFVEQVFVVIGTDKKEAASPESPPPRFGCQKTQNIFDVLTEKNINWCKYCGTTQGVNWRPGPWGPKTLCNRHGCDFMGYGFAANKPKLDLSSFYGEPLSLRKIPVIKEFCFECISKTTTSTNPILMCHGCPRAYHLQCYKRTEIPQEAVDGKRAWYCEDCCIESFETLHVFVELPKGIPFGINSKSPTKDASVKRDTRPKPEVRSTKSSPRKRFLTIKKPHADEQPAFHVFDTDVLERHSFSSTVIEIPKWIFYESSAASSGAAAEDGPAEINDALENTDDSVYHKRHAKYESLERNNKLYIIK